MLLVVSRAGRTAGTACDLHCVSVCWEMEAKTHTKLKTNERKYFIYTAGSFPSCMQNLLSFTGNLTCNRLPLTIHVSCLQCVSVVELCSQLGIICLLLFSSWQMDLIPDLCSYNG